MHQVECCKAASNSWELMELWSPTLARNGPFWSDRIRLRLYWHHFCWSVSGQAMPKQLHDPQQVGWWVSRIFLISWYQQKITKRCLYFWVFLRNHSFEFVCIKHFSKFSLVWDPFFKLISRSSQCPKSHGNLACLSPCRWQAFAQLHISKRLYVLRGHKGYSLMMFDGHFQCIASIYHLASKML